MSDIKVSVIVPVYNVERYIEKCINSIINQTYKNLEIIIVNDGSTDKSEETILKKMDEDSRIKYIKKQNGGLSSARNVGIKEAVGKYICFVDSDDWIDKKYVETLIYTAEQNNSEMVICNIRHIFDDGTIKEKTAHIEKNETISSYQAIKQLFLGKKYRCHAVNKFCKTSLYKENHIFFPEGKIYEDVFTTYRLILSAKRISLCKEYLYFYLRNRIGSILTSSFNEKRLNLLEALNEIIENKDIKKLNLKEELQYFYLQEVLALFTYIYPIYNKKNKKKIKECFKKINKSRNQKIYIKYFSNKYIKFSSKIRIAMINHCPRTYCNIMKFLKRGEV